MADALQTATAAMSVVQLAFQTYEFIKAVVNAGVEARILSQKTYRLYRLVKAVEARLHIREQLRGSRLVPPSEAEIEDIVRENLVAVRKGLLSINRKLRGLANGEPIDFTSKVLKSLKYTLSTTTIRKQEKAAETNIQILSTALHLLQLLEHAGTQKRIDRLEKAVNRAVAHLKSLAPQRSTALPPPTYTPSALDSAEVSIEPDVDLLSVQVLEKTIRVAKSAHSTYGSMSEPDRASLVAMEAALSSDESDVEEESDAVEPDLDVPNIVEPDRRNSRTQSQPEDPNLGLVDHPIGKGRYPPKMLSKEKQKFQERAAREFAKGSYGTAEEHLREAFDRGMSLEEDGHEPFADKKEMRKRLLDVYMKQSKYGEAVKELQRLLQELDSTETPGLILERAILNKTLAQVHHSMYLSNKEQGNRDGAEKNIYLAEIYAIERSFIDLEQLSESPNGVITKNCPGFIECVQLIIQILEDQGKTVQAEAWREEQLEGSHPAFHTPGDHDWEHIPAGDGESAIDPRETQLRQLETPGRTRLINAIIFDLPDDFQAILTNLIEKGGDIDERCEQGLTPIMHAVACNHGPGCSCEKAIEKLVHHEADINATTGPYGETALHQAAAAGNEQMVGLLLSKEADKDASAPHTPLLVAVKNNQTLTADMLLDAGADPTLLNVDRWSMLHHAVNSNAFDALLTLLSSKHKDKIDIEARSSTGGTALLLAAERASKAQNHALADALLQKGADVNATDSFDRSALYFATNGPPTAERESFVELLLRYGAEPGLTLAKFQTRFKKYAALRQGSEGGSRERGSRASFSRELGTTRRDSGTTMSSVVSVGMETGGSSPRSGLFGLKFGRRNSGK